MATSAVCFTCWEWAGVDEVDTPGANTTVLSSVHHADLSAAFLVGIHRFLEKIVFILLTNFEDNTVIGGYVCFLPHIFLLWLLPPNSPSKKCRDLEMSEERQMKGVFISACVFW